MKKKLIVLFSLAFFQNNLMAHTAAELFEAARNNDKEEVIHALSMCGSCPSSEGCAYNYEENRCDCPPEVYESYKDNEDYNNCIDNDGQWDVIDDVCYDSKEDKATIFTKDAEGRTILHIAAFYGYVEIVKAILDAYALTSYRAVILEARDNSNNTPLHYAVKQRQNEVAKLLIDAGADIQAKNNEGKSVVDMLLETATVEGDSDIAFNAIEKGPSIITSIELESLVECSNKSYHWGEDALILDLKNMTASYFDNDESFDVPCKIQNGFLLCHIEDNPSYLMVRVLSNGLTTAIYTPEQWVDFSCPLPEKTMTKIVDSRDA